MPAAMEVRLVFNVEGTAQVPKSRVITPTIPNQCTNLQVYILGNPQNNQENCNFRYSISSRGRFRIQVYPFRKDCFPYKSLFFALQKHWITFNVSKCQEKDDATTHRIAKERFSRVGRVAKFKPNSRTLVRIYPQITPLYQQNINKSLDKAIPFSKSRACTALRAHWTVSCNYSIGFVGDINASNYNLH